VDLFPAYKKILHLKNNFKSKSLFSLLLKTKNYKKFYKQKYNLKFMAEEIPNRYILPAIRNNPVPWTGIAAVAALGALVTLGVYSNKNKSSPEPLQPTASTNTSSISSGLESFTVQPYSTDEIRIGGDSYRAIPLGENSTMQVGYTQLNRNVILAHKLIPYGNSIDTQKLGENSTRVQGFGIEYALVNVGFNEDGTYINRGNEPIRARLVFDRKPLEDEVLKDNGITLTRQFKEALKKVGRINLEGTQFYTQILDLEDPQFDVGWAIPRALMSTGNSKPVMKNFRSDGEKFGEFGLEGEIYVPLIATEVSLPEPPKPEPQKATIRALTN